MTNLLKTKTAMAAGALILANFALAGNAAAHCDGLDGPVIIEARSALEKKDVTPLLKWVPEASEHTIKESFARTLQDRSNGKAAQDAARRLRVDDCFRFHTKRR